MKIFNLAFGVYSDRLSEFPASIAVVQSALDEISEVITQRFEASTRILFDLPNPIDKCRDCLWFHRETGFCAVAPQNLTTIDCDERQLSEPPASLDYLEARSPERIALIRYIARKLDREEEILERKLYSAWAKHPESFDELTLTILAEVEKIGGYSIAQMELIGDCIRGSSEDFRYSHARALEVKDMTAAGDEFHNVIYRILLMSPGYF